MSMQALKVASETATPTYEISSNAIKNFLYLAVTILVGVMVVLGPTGCSLTPEIYKMSPENLEGIRSGVGRIGVTITSHLTKQEILKPAEGISGGAARGFVVGAAAPVVIGAVTPVPGATLVGLLVAPFTAVAGSVYGTTKGVPAEVIEKAEAASAQAVDRMKKMNLRQTFIEEVERLGKERTGLDFVTLADMDLGGPNEVIRYDRMEMRKIDTVLELKIEKAGLWGPYSFDPPSLAFIEVRVQLIRVEDNEILISEILFCASEVERRYIEWAENDGQLFIDEFVACIPDIAGKIVDDLFLVRPIPWR